MLLIGTGMLALASAKGPAQSTEVRAPKKRKVAAPAVVTDSISDKLVFFFSRVVI